MNSTFENNLFTKTDAPSERAIDRKKLLKRILEALLFSSADPLSLDKLKEIISSSYPIRSKELLSLIQELKGDYQKEGRGFQLDEIAEGYVLRTTEEMTPFIELLHQNKRTEKISKAATEVLAIVAGKQPITRSQIDMIRGVDSSGPLTTLVERGLVEVVGRLEAPGRPAQYGITIRFLQHYGLKTTKDLQI